MSKFTTSRLFCVLALMVVVSTTMQAQSRRGLIRLTRIGPVVQVESTVGETVARTTYDTDQNGERITEDNIVITTGENSRVILVFSNGATINVAADSELDIKAFRQDPFAGEYSITDATAEPPARSRTEIYLKRGELVGNVKSLREDSTFTVSTPAGSAGIRGTTFRVVFRPTGTGQAFFSVTTLEGDVGVTTGNGEAEVPIGVLESQEVTLIVEVDDVTGEVTILTPPEDMVVGSATPESLAGITEAAQQSVEEVLTIVLTSEADQVEASAGDEADTPEEQSGGQEEERDEGGEPEEEPTSETPQEEPTSETPQDEQSMTAPPTNAENQSPGAGAD